MGLSISTPSKPSRASNSNFSFIGVLIYLGYQTSQGAASQVGEVFTGRPSDNAIYYYIGGAVCVVLGLGGFAFGRGKR